MIQELLIFLGWKLEWLTRRSLVDDAAERWPRFQAWLVSGIEKTLKRHGGRLWGIPEKQGLPWSFEDDAAIRYWMR